MVQGIILEPVSFIDLGMYTESGKMKRRALYGRYQKQIQELYKKLE